MRRASYQRGGRIIDGPAMLHAEELNSSVLTALSARRLSGHVDAEPDCQLGTNTAGHCS